MRFRRLYEASFEAPRGAPVTVVGDDPEEVARRAYRLREYLWETAVNTLPPPPEDGGDGIITVPTRTPASPPPWRAAYPGEETPQ